VRREQFEVRPVARLNHYDGSFPLFYVGRSVVRITRPAVKIESYPAIDCIDVRPSVLQGKPEANGGNGMGCFVMCFRGFVHG